jgi:LPXTG-motif cell wall-anchored protein
LKLSRIGAVMATLLISVIALAGPASAASVSAIEYRFVPATVRIHVGESVTWTNNGTVPHTSTADKGLWDSGPLNPGQSFAFTFKSAGTFPYHCQFHVGLGMVGSVVVQAASTTPPPTTPPPTNPTSTNGSSASLPFTGSNFGPFVWLGLSLLVSGGAIFFALRRRRT